MFTSSIKSKSFFNGELKVEVQFEDGVQKWTETFTVLNADDLNQRIRGRLKALTTLETVVTSLAEGVYTPTEPTAQTQEDIDREKWFRQIQKLRAFQELKTLGGMPPAWQADLDALALKVQADAKKIYLANI